MQNLFCKWGSCIDSVVCNTSRRVIAVMVGRNYWHSDRTLQYKHLPDVCVHSKLNFASSPNEGRTSEMETLEEPAYIMLNQLKQHQSSMVWPDLHHIFTTFLNLVPPWFRNWEPRSRNSTGGGSGGQRTGCDLVELGDERNWGIPGVGWVKSGWNDLYHRILGFQIHFDQLHGRLSPRLSHLLRLQVPWDDYPNRLWHLVLLETASQLQRFQENHKFFMQKPCDNLQNSYKSHQARNQKKIQNCKNKYQKQFCTLLIWKAGMLAAL